MTNDQEAPRTTARLQADIQKGATGDKVAAWDPAAAPMGTDDEAAGHPPSERRIDMSMREERRPVGRQPSDSRAWVAYLLIAAAATAGGGAVYFVFG